MYSKLILLIATLYIVNASVITLDASDDDVQIFVDSEDNTSLRGCSDQECDQRCRRLQFSGGVCVNGRCKCDNYRRTEELTSLIEEYPTLRKCNPQECHQRCRKLKFPGGACVNGRCKCDNFRFGEESSLAEDVFNNKAEEYEDNLDEEIEDFGMEVIRFASDLEEFPKKRRCRNRKCNHVCRYLHHENGTCVNNRCICAGKINTTSSVDVTYDYKAEESKPSFNEKVGDTVLESAGLTSNPTDFAEKPRCRPRSCNRLCRLKRFENGTCVDGRCKCAKKVERALVADETVDKQVQESDLNWDEVQDTVMQIAEYPEDSRDPLKAPRCIPRICNRVCRLKRYENGTCVDGQCKCTKKVERTFDTDETVDNKDEESNLNWDEVQDTDVQIAEHLDDSRDVPRCIPRICNRVCRLKRYENGTCVDGRCKCTKKVERTFDTDEIVDNQDEESYLNWDEVQDTDVQIAEHLDDSRDAPRCIPRICNRVCRLKRYENGTCVDGRCKCTKKVERTFGTDETVDNKSEESDLNWDEVQDIAIQIAEHQDDSGDSLIASRCIPRICNRVCRLKRYENGTCVDGRFERTFIADETVDNKGEESDLKWDEVQDTVKQIAEYREDSRDSPKALRCNPRICSRVCRFLRFDNGTCVNGRCKCDRKVNQTTPNDVTTPVYGDTSKPYESNLIDNED